MAWNEFEHDTNRETKQIITLFIMSFINIHIAPLIHINTYMLKYTYIYIYTPLTLYFNAMFILQSKQARYMPKVKLPQQQLDILSLLLFPL